VVLGLMVLYLKAGVSVRVGLVAIVILIWLAFFAYCELEFQKTKLKTESGNLKSQ
jgi:hypothetical protein